VRWNATARRIIMTVFGRAAPTLHVRDALSAIDFWDKKLGFAVTFTNGEPVSFAIVKRGGAEIHLATSAERAGKGHCHILVTGIEALSLDVASRGVEVRQPLKVQPWGMRDIVLADEDGNTIEIGENIESRES
jgi:catechol 2,3-dioxygenase-like lactoylglutathione lyase family enzyme